MVRQVGAKRCKLDYCRFGEEHQKPTFIWTNIESMIQRLTEDPSPYLCKDTPCKHGMGYHERLGRGGHTEPLPQGDRGGVEVLLTHKNRTGRGSARAHVDAWAGERAGVGSRS